ncbi:MAG: MFS transporter [Deltaproteobacteria bacterium]|nr:MFS transporter [Deltaproteobacteria bacterium]
MTEQIQEKVQRALSDSAAMRWGILLLASVAMATNYYFYDVLSPIQDLLQKELGISPSQYGTILLFYSIPNGFFFLAAFGGIICDKLGIRLTGRLFFTSMLVGAGLTYYATTPAFNGGGPGHGLLSSFLTGYSPALKLMCIGFLFFGLGAETSCVVISKAIVKWFRGRELALALGVNVGIARLASSATFAVGAYLSKPDFTRPVAFGFALMASGFLAFLVYAAFDKRLDRSLPAEKKSEDEFHILDALKLLATPSYLFVVLLCVTFYSAVFPFNKYAVDLLQNKFAFDKQTAGILMSALPIAQAFITPFFGWVCDFKGKSATLMIIGSLLLAVGHLTLSLTSIHPIVPLAILGIAFSLVPAAMWPALAKIVEEKRLGTAYGLTFSIQNIGLALTTPLIGYVLELSNPKVVALKQQAAALLAKGAGPDDPIVKAAEAAVYNYRNPILMLSIFGLFGLVFAFLLKRADKTGGFGLEQPNKMEKRG